MKLEKFVKILCLKQESCETMAELRVEIDTLDERICLLYTSDAADE